MIGFLKVYAIVFPLALIVALALCRAAKRADEWINSWHESVQ